MFVMICSFCLTIYFILKWYNTVILSVEIVNLKKLQKSINEKKISIIEKPVHLVFPTVLCLIYDCCRGRCPWRVKWGYNVKKWIVQNCTNIWNSAWCFVSENSVRQLTKHDWSVTLSRNVTVEFKDFVWDLRSIATKNFNGMTSLS